MKRLSDRGKGSSKPPLSTPREPRDAHARPKPRRRGLRPRAILLLLGLLICPVWALVLVSRFVNGQYVAGYAVFISFFTYTLYWKDKQQAETGGWRTPEATLHFLELIGGWPAAFVMQRVARHKIVKRWYQINFWSIVAIHQYVALDFVVDWRFSRAALMQFGALVARVLPQPG